MSMPCGIFWDIQNVDIPKQKLITPEMIVREIKEKIISKYDLCRKDFYVAGENNTVTEDSISSLRSLGARFEQCGSGRNAADELIKTRMREFIWNYGEHVGLIVLTGDADFAAVLKEHREKGATIYVIHKGDCASSKIDEISNYVFHLKKGSLELKKSPQATDNNRDFFVKISCLSDLPTKLLAEIVNDLSSHHGSYAVHTGDGDIWCLFDDIDDAKEAAYRLEGTYKYNSKSFVLETQIEVSPPIHVRNLIECAKLSNPIGLAKDRTGQFNLPKYKPGLVAYDSTLDDSDDSDYNQSTIGNIGAIIGNAGSTIDNITSIINTINGHRTSQPPSYRSSNTGSNNAECTLS